MSSTAVMSRSQPMAIQTEGDGGCCEGPGDTADQDGEPPYRQQDAHTPRQEQPPSPPTEGNTAQVRNSEEADTLVNGASLDPVCEEADDNTSPEVRLCFTSDSSANKYQAASCGIPVPGEPTEKPQDCAASSSITSPDASICNSIFDDPDEGNVKLDLVDNSTQTSPVWDNSTHEDTANQSKSDVLDGSCDCETQKKPCFTNLGRKSISERRQGAHNQQISTRLDVARTGISKISLTKRRHKTSNSDYSSLSSSDSPRVSDSSNRSDSGNSPGSSSSSSSTNGGCIRNGDTGTRKVSAGGELSPIASCGGESSINVGFSVNTGLSSDSSCKDLEGRSPSTPNSGCLKAGTRAASGAHVQFDTPYDEEDASSLHHDTLVTQDGQVSIHKPNGGSATPTHGEQLSRLWAKLMPDTSPTDAVSNLSMPKKWRRRQISGSSSISLGSSSSDSSNSQATEFERRAPDGGWGWVIVAASFMVHCIADGVTMSFGVLFVELLSYFKEGKSLTSWIGSLFMAIPLLAGPLASLLTDRYGCQTVTICGAVVACFGFFVSAFVNTIPLLLLTVGIITGLGLAVCYVAAIVIVAFYFEKKRSLATGVAVAGSGIGTFLFAPLIQYLVDYWGWRLCFIILAGIFLNMVVCGALMRDLEWTPRDSSSLRDANTTVSSRRASTSQSSETVGGRGGSVGIGLPSLEELRRLVQSGDVAALLSPDDTPCGTLRGSASLMLLPTFLSRSQVLPPDVLPCLSSRTNAYEVVSHMYPHLLSHSLSGHVNQIDQIHAQLDKQHSVSENENVSNYSKAPHANIGSSTSYSQERPLLQTHPPDESVSQPCCDTDSTTPGSVGGDISLHNENYKTVDIQIGLFAEDDHCDDADNEEENEEPMEVTAMLGSGRVRGLRQGGQRRISAGCMGASSSPPPAAPLRNMKVNRQSMTYRGAMLNIHRYRLRASSCPDIYRNSIITIAKSRDERVWTYLDDVGEMMTSCVDVSHCTDAAYLIFAVSNFVLYIFYDTVYMYLTDYAQGVGVSADDSANLISVIGILNCLGMVVMGYVGDRHWSSPMLIYNISMVICGLSVIFMPFITNYWVLAVAAAIFGLFISANYALTSVILVELVSLEAFSKAYGLLLLIQGLANLIGPPLVGFIADTTGDYMVPFLVSGIFIVACGLILNAIPLIQRYRSLYPSSTSSPVETPKNRSPTVTPNHTFKKRPEPAQV